MAHRLLRDVEADGWESSEFPIICESCLGDNPYVRMVCLCSLSRSFSMSMPCYGPRSRRFMVLGLGFPNVC